MITIRLVQFFMASLLLASPVPEQADDNRVALVIGNSKYPMPKAR